MNEIISTAIVAVGFVGSVCSILAFSTDCLIKFRRRRRRKKMMGK